MPGGSPPPLFRSKLPYRDPATCAAPPPAGEAHGRAALPPRAGVGTDPAGLGRPLAKPYDATVADGRALLRAAAPTLDVEGYKLARMETRLRPDDFRDVGRILADYFPEVEEVVRREVPGASAPGARVLIFDHAVRSGGERLQGDAQVNPYAGLVHCDATVRSGHTRAKDQILGTTETAVKYGRLPDCWRGVQPGRAAQRELFRSESRDHDSPDGVGGEHMIVNVWRPIRGPVRQWPLAVMDASSVGQGDDHPTILLKYDNTPGGQAGTSERMQSEGTLKVHDLDGQPVSYRVGEVLTPLPDPAHRWTVFPGMTPSEALLLKVFDSRADGRARFCSHSAVFDPDGPADAHRESIEVRCLITLPPGGARL